jgi:hypothetical protein
MSDEEFVPKAAWLTRFGRWLMQLHPMMTAVAAARLSVDAHQRRFGESPEDAAESLLPDHIVSAAAAPRQAMRDQRS